MSIKCCTIKNYHLYLKLFKQNFLACDTIIYWYNILVLIKLKSSLAKNIIGLTSKKMLNLISKTAIFVSFWKQSNISAIIIFRLY